VYSERDCVARTYKNNIIIDADVAQPLLLLQPQIFMAPGDSFGAQDVCKSWYSITHGLSDVYFKN